MLIHLGIWSIYCCIELLKLSFAFNIFNDHNFLIETVINLLVGTTLFYLLTLFVLPTSEKTTQALQILWRLILSLLVCFALRRTCILLMAELTNFKSPVITNLKYFFVSSIDTFFQFGIYASIVWFFRRQGELKQQILQKQLEKEKLKGELLETKHSVLKAQINPHFLFNTLNFIHSKAIVSNEPIIDKTVLLLSDILRHALEDSTNGKLIPIHKELEHIQKLYALNRLRFNNNYHLIISEKGGKFYKKIPPLILLTFYENAMKYGTFDDPENPVLLQIEQSPSFLEIRLTNKIQKLKQVNSLAQFSIGKRYIKNILEQFYQNNYTLDYLDDGVFHTVHLKIHES